MSSCGNLFTYKDCFSYNDESFAYTDCVLLKDVNDTLKKGTIILEAILNVKSNKIKFNTDNKVYVIAFTLSWGVGDVSEKSVDSPDSDFDDESSVSGSDSSDTDSD